MRGPKLYLIQPNVNPTLATCLCKLFDAKKYQLPKIQVELKSVIALILIP
jgi:hypothetical protein